MVDYASILQAVGQGYGQDNQNAMQIAQMPTFADKFLASLRAGEDSNYKQQMGMSQFEVNKAYKQAQEQQMRDNARLSEIQKRTGVLGYISKELMPSKYNEVVAQVKAMGGDPSWVSQQQFTPGTTESTYEMLPNAPGMSLAEGGETTNTTVPARDPEPVEGSGWGTDAWLKNKGLETKWDIASLNDQTKSQLSQLKAMEPKDALGKIEWDLQRGIISPEGAAMRRWYVSTKINPEAGPAYAAGTPTSPTITGSIGGAPVSPGLQLIYDKAKPAQATQSLPSVTQAPAAAPTSGKAPTKVLNVKGEKEVADLKTQRDVVDNSLTSTMNLIQSLIDDADLPNAVGRTGALNRTENFYTNAKANNVFNMITRLKNSGVLASMKALKESGTSFGQQSDAEGRRLETAYSSINLANDDPTLVVKELKRLLAETKASKDLLVSKANEKLRAFGVEDAKPGRPTAVGPGGKVLTLSEDGTRWE